MTITGIVLTAITAGTGTPGTMIHGTTVAGMAPTITITGITVTTAIMAIMATTGTEITGMEAPAITGEAYPGLRALAGGKATSPAVAVQPELPEA